MKQPSDIMTNNIIIIQVMISIPFIDINISITRHTMTGLIRNERRSNDIENQSKQKGVHHKVYIYTWYAQEEVIFIRLIAIQVQQ